MELMKQEVLDSFTEGVGVRGGVSRWAHSELLSSVVHR